MKPLLLSFTAIGFAALITITSIGAEQLSGLDAELNQLLARLRSPLNKSGAHDRAADELLKLGTNALPLLLQKVRSIDGIAVTNPALAGEHKEELQAAFQVLGTNARPILPDLVHEFQSGRCLGNAPDAIANMGGEESGRVLIAAMTNKESRIRACGAAALAIMVDEDETARKAIPPLLRLLNDSVIVPKTVAATTLGTLGREPEVVVHALLKVAETDPDPVARLAALGAVRRFRGRAAFAKARLQAIAREDAHTHVRKFADKVAGEF
jgi:hypothetical protein